MSRRHSPLRRLEQRYHEAETGPAAYRVRDEQLRTQSISQRIWRPFMERGGGALSRQEKQTYQQMLAQAGYPGGVTVRQLGGIRLMLTLGCGLVAFLLAMVVRGIGDLSKYLDGMMLGLIVIVSAGVGWMSLPFILRILVKKRQKLVQKTLPDVLDLITIAVEAGLGFDAAMDRVGNRYEGAMGEELVRTNNEIRMGRPWNDAMKDLAARTGVEDVRSLVTALIQAKELGVNLGNVLRAQSLKLREERARRAREQAQKAPTKMMFPLILFIFPTLFIVLIGPAALKAAKTLSESNPFGNKAK